ncbi:MAG: S24/S26 family peptidase [Ruminococcus sp.]|nr:S24/S26 family peptidase [Ruminococcus sp.]
MNIEQYLDTHETLVFNNKGVSMLPMLRQDRDLMILRKKQPDERCKKYDVAVYVRPPHDYVLHRIIKVEENGYVFLGDNCVLLEPDIREEQVIAVMTGFVHKGKQYDVSHRGYKLYYHVWYYLYPIRRTLKIFRGKLQRFKHRVTDRK